MYDSLNKKVYIGARLYIYRLKMLTVSYDPKTDEIVVTMAEEGSMEMSESIPFSEFLEKIEVDEARLELLKCEAYNIRQKRFKEIDEFMEKIIELTAGIEETRKKMLEMDPATQGKSVRVLAEIVKAFSAQKNTLKEMRFAIKLLDNAEARILVKLNELKV